MTAKVWIGTAGWAIPREAADAFPPDGSGLERYAARLSAAEINTSFYKPHRRSTYERWAASTPDGFRFAAKVPKAITHERKLVGAEGLIDPFLEDVAALGAKLGPLLIQLPPSLGFGAEAERFLRLWAERWTGQTAIEPRHSSWFTHEVDALLADLRIARAAADPAVVPDAAEPGGWRDLTYVRLHGSPQMYSSSYEPDRLAAIAGLLRAPDGEAWCIFDNTRLGAAAANALSLQETI